MMNKKFKKIVSMLLVGAMAVSMAACGKKSDDKKPEDQGNNGSTNTESTATPAPEKEESTKTLADYKKAEAFNYYNLAAGVTDEEFNALPLAKLVEDQTGYKVTYTQSPADPTDMQTAITNIFMLKQDYQAVKVSKDQFYTLLAMNALKPITEYVNASTNLKEQISEFGWGTASKDGEIYAIPQKNAFPSTDVGICYRKDWLEEYNAANPSAQIPVPSEENGYSMTLTDYKAMLTYFATKVPTGGYAMAIDTNGVFIENILPAFGIYQEWADVNGKLTYVVDQPGFADYAAYMEDLYDSGLVLYQATSDDAGAVKSLQAKTVGAGRIAHWNAYAIETTGAAEGTDLSTYTDDSIGYISALVPDDCKGDKDKVRLFAREGYAYYTVVPNFASEEQAAAVVDFADKKLEKDFFLQLVLGTEGDTFNVVDGQYYPVLPAFNDKQGFSDKFMDGTREGDYAAYWLCRTRKTVAQDKMFSQSNYNISATGIQNPVTVMPPNEAYDTYYNAANTEVKNAIVVSMYQKNVPFDLAAVQAKFKEFEGDAITEAVNSWYGSWELKDQFNTVKPR